MRTDCQPEYRLVKNLALKFAGSGYELEDLLQIGFMGLLKAIERF